MYIMFNFISSYIKGSKNISIKMLKDVGMTVPKSRETSAVYIYSKTEDEGSIYAARQGMRAATIITCVTP